MTNSPLAIEIVVPQGETRGWHAELAARLRRRNYRVFITPVAVDKGHGLLDAVLHAEQNLLGFAKTDLVTRCDLEPVAGEGYPDLCIDLTGTVTAIPAPILSVRLAGAPHLGQPATMIARGGLPDITVLLDDEPVELGRPMIDNRVSVVRGLEDVFARALSLLVASVERWSEGEKLGGHPARQGAQKTSTPGRAAFARAYFGATLPRLVSETLRRLTHRTAHWRVGYRFIAGPGVAETADLSGTPWSVLPDDGTHFYADPFPFQWQGRNFVFVEDFAHAENKAEISVFEISASGEPSAPRPVISEDYHLSYPQVFARNGDVWMLPEASAGKTLVLYRAVDFPFRWERHTVLIADRELSDATLIDKDGRLWLVATERAGAGSTSDMLVVYGAAHLEGPWTPHPANPIFIDRARARPGGAAIRTGGRLVLPVQDGTNAYGGGLGLSEIETLTDKAVTLKAPVPIDGEGFWPYPAIHTLNRAGGLEVIDGIATVSRWWRPRERRIKV